MLPTLILPASWRALLETFRPAFARAPTFGLFMLLATGLVAQTSRRTVVGMLAGAGMATVVSFHSACRFFSQHVWAPDQLGLLLARLIVTRLLAQDAPLVIAIDDTLFRRWGRRVHAAFWTHDGAAQGPAKLGRGNRWIIAGLVVQLPFCSHPVCLPVLCRLWAGKGVDAQVFPQVGAFSAHVIPQGYAHVIPHREGERVALGVVLAVGRLLPSHRAGGGRIGEENVQRGRRDRDLGSLACGPVAE